MQTPLTALTADNIVTIPVSVLGHQLGFPLVDQEAALGEAIQAAFDLD